MDAAGGSHYRPVVTRRARQRWALHPARAAREVHSKSAQSPQPPDRPAELLPMRILRQLRQNPSEQRRRQHRHHHRHRHRLVVTLQLLPSALPLKPSPVVQTLLRSPQDRALALSPFVSHRPRLVHPASTSCSSRTAKMGRASQMSLPARALRPIVRPPTLWIRRKSQKHLRRLRLRRRLRRRRRRHRCRRRHLMETSRC